MKTGNPFRNMSTVEILDAAARFSEAQSKLAADTKEDAAYWHHFSLGTLLLELAGRLKTNESLLAFYDRAEFQERVMPRAGS